MDNAIRAERAPAAELLKTGVPGLDSILKGGLAPRRLYLLEGEPGCGKTTLALQFLLEGARQGEKVLYITLSETAEELHQVALSHGWSLEGVNIHEVIPGEEVLSGEETYTVFHPSEIELSEAMRSFLNEIERLQPTRLVLDSLAELRLLAGSALRYRRHVLALKQFFADRRVTALVIDDRSAQEQGDQQVQSVAHGLIVMQQEEREHGTDRRRLRIVKYRATSYHGGSHDFIIRNGGLEVFRRLNAGDHGGSTRPRLLSSGLPRLDQLFGGGIESGTSTLFIGAPGTGKSTLAAQFADAAAKRGEAVAMFCFDEAPPTLLARTTALGMNLAEHQEAGRLSLTKIEPAALSPGQFIQLVRDTVDQMDAQVVVIDSLNGYLLAMPDERFLVIQLHELLSFLASRGVSTFLISTQAGLIGNNMSSVVDASYLADNVLLLRFFEAEGAVRQAISVLKKRGGRHERTIREFSLDNGLHVGEPLTQFHGVLTGVPEYRGGAHELRAEVGKS